MYSTISTRTFTSQTGGCIQYIDRSHIPHWLTGEIAHKCSKRAAYFTFSASKTGPGRVGGTQAHLANVGVPAGEVSCTLCGRNVDTGNNQWLLRETLEYPLNDMNAPKMSSQLTGLENGQDLPLAAIEEEARRKRKP